jgi:two-component system, NtrC family, response regulator AtoC
MPFSVLIVDDEIEMCLSLSEILRSHGYRARHTTNPCEVAAMLRGEAVDLIVMDVKMQEKDGLSLLREIRAEHRSIPVIMISGYASAENVVRAMKYGAMNFYEKPLRISELVKEVQQLARMNESSARARHAPLPPAFQVCSNNPHMREIFRTIEKVAPTDASVVIMGESGTGKELVADALHAGSPRRGKPFVKINCAAIPETLLESELFGFEEGAFTGATKLRKGKFELADGGSLFLDEIGDLSLDTQAKLLRVLQERELTRLGGARPVKADVRIIAATNKDIAQMIQKGTFREDLYYRMSVITIALPPLRERTEDIGLLAGHFLQQFNATYGKRINGFTDGVRQVLLAHHWPGNVRELKNCMERAVIFCEGEELSEEDLPRQYTAYAVDERRTLEGAYDALSRTMIVDALEKSAGVKHKAADLLRIHRKTLYNKMKKLGLEP